MSMNTPIGNITQTTPIKDFKELDEMQNEQYLLGIDNNEIGNGSKISLENLINSSISTDNGNLIRKGADDRLLVNTPVEIGDLSDLATTNKSTLVAAINEVNGDIATEVTNRVNAVSAEATTRANADNNLQSQIDAITSASDVTDIVGTYAQLQAYDTTGLPDNSVIKVLQDESRQNETTYYRWVITGGVGEWVLVGEEGPYYTISQVDSKFATQEAVGNLNNLATSDKSSVVNAMNELASVLDPTQTADYIKNSKAIYSGEVSENALILPQIKEMTHSTFDRSKFTVVGSPVITNDGIASGFGSDGTSHIRLPYLLCGENDAWEMEWVFKTGAFTTASYSQCIINNNSRCMTDGGALKQFAIYSSGETGANPSLSIYGFGSGFNFSSNDTVHWAPNTNFKLILGQNNVKRYATLYNIDESTSTTREVLMSTVTEEVKTYFTSDTITKISVGASVASRQNNTQLDLKGFKFTVNGIPVYTGNKTGIDTIKPDDYTVVGSPTISADGVASGFSSENYIKNSNVSIPFSTTKDTIIKCRIKMPSTRPTTGNPCAVGSEGNNFLRLYISSGANTRFSFYIRGTIIGFAYDTDTYYDIIAQYHNGVISLSYKKASDTSWNEVAPATVSDTTDFSGAIVIGNRGDYIESWAGSIDLNSFKIYVDGNLVYQPCLKIPYTESKTWSKIVNSIYRDRVTDMYEQFGYAPYYTIQADKKANYTVVGTPTISADGIASGFSTSNYIEINTNLVNHEAELEFIAPSDVSNKGIFRATSLEEPNYYVDLAGSGTIYLRYWDGSSIANLNSEIVAIPNERYNIKIVQNENTLSFKINNYAEKIVQNFVSKGTINKFAFGVDSSSHSLADGSIDLNAFKIYVDNKLEYQAITEPNFTLPMGDIYGYLEKRARDIAHPIAQPFYRFSDEINEDEVRLEGAEVDKGLYLAIEQDSYLSALCTAGSTSDKICLPDFRNRVIYGDVVSGYVEPELPNVTGGLNFSQGFNNLQTVMDASGAFYFDGTGDSATMDECSQSKARLKTVFDASRSSSIYKNNGTVKTAGVKARWLCRWK